MKKILVLIFGGIAITSLVCIILVVLRNKFVEPVECCTGFISDAELAARATPEKSEITIAHRTEVDLGTVVRTVFAEQIIIEHERLLQDILTQAPNKAIIFDEKNYYVHSSDGAEGSFTIAVFLHSSVNPIVILDYEMCPPSGCYEEIYEFYYTEPGKLVAMSGNSNAKAEHRIPEITFQDIPKLEAAVKDPFIDESGEALYRFEHELPRNGTTIAIVEDISGEQVGEIRWQKGKFIPEIYPPANR